MSGCDGLVCMLSFEAMKLLVIVRSVARVVIYTVYECRDGFACDFAYSGMI